MLKEIAEKGFTVLPCSIEKELVLAARNDFIQLVIQQLERLNVEYLSNQMPHYYIRMLADIDLSAYFACVSASESLYSMFSVMVGDKLKNIYQSSGIKIASMPIRPALHIVDSHINKLITDRDGYHELPQHQDWSALQSSIDTLVFWIPTQDITKDIPGVELVPGSHLLGHIPTEEHKFGHTIVTDSQFDDSDFIKPKLNFGEILVFSSFLVHRSESSVKLPDSSRIAISFRASNLQNSEFINRLYHRSYRTSVSYEHGVSKVSAKEVEESMLPDE